MIGCEAMNVSPVHTVRKAKSVTTIPRHLNHSLAVTVDKVLKGNPPAAQGDNALRHVQALLRYG